MATITIFLSACGVGLYTWASKYDHIHVTDLDILVCMKAIISYSVLIFRILSSGGGCYSVCVF